MKKRIRRNSDDRLRRYEKLLQKTPRDIEVVRRYLSELLHAQGDVPEPHERPRGALTQEQRLEEAVPRFQQRDFSRVPVDLISPALDVLWRRELGDLDEDNHMPMPNSGSVFVVTDSHAEELITAMLESLSPDVPRNTEEVTRLIRRFDLFHLDLELEADEDEEDFLERVHREAMRVYENREEPLLAAGGWQRVGGTDFYAIMCNDHLVLSYDVGDEFTSCWIPLYHALGLEWHTDQ